MANTQNITGNAPVINLEKVKTAAQKVKTAATSDTAKTAALIALAAIGLAVLGLGIAQQFGANIFPKSFQAYSVAGIAVGGVISVIAIGTLLGRYLEKQEAKKALETKIAAKNQQSLDRARARIESIGKLPKQYQERAQKLANGQAIIELTERHLFKDNEYDVILGTETEVTLKHVQDKIENIQAELKVLGFTEVK
jgi:hypothetical protein